MALDPKDLRLKLDPDLHALLGACADLEGKGIAELGEEVIQAYVLRRVHEATVIADRVGHLGFSGKLREFQGKPGKGQR